MYYSKNCFQQTLEDFIVLAETTGDFFSGCSKNSFAVMNYDNIIPMIV